MNIYHFGPVISLYVEANELNESTIIELPAGYSYEQILINSFENIHFK